MTSASGSWKIRSESRSTAACTGSVRARPGAPASTTTSVGVSAPAPALARSSASPCTDGAWPGSAEIEPGVTCRKTAGTAAATRIAVPTARNATGRRMIARASRAQKPLSTSIVPGRTGTRMPKRERRRAATGTRRAPRRPKTESSAGCSVAAAAIDASGTRKPPTPSERMNGTGTNRSSASPIATVAPEKTTARPAVAIVRTTASSAGPVVAGELLAEAVDDEQRVVDGEPEPDQLDEVRHVADHREHMRRRVDGRERSGDRAGREHERDQHDERQSEHGDEHEQRDRERDLLAAAQVGGEDRLEIVLDRGLAGDECRGRAAERAPEPRRVALRVLEVERRVDVGVEDAAGRLELRRVAGGHGARRRGEPAREPGAQRAVGGVPHLEDDGEDAVGPLAEVVGEDRARPVAVRAGHVEGVREQRREVERGGDPDREDGEPAEEHGHAEAEDGAGPALGHGGRLVRGPDP